MKYREEIHDTKNYKINYVEGIERVIKRRQCEAEKERREYIKDVFTESERYRKDFIDMLGWPLVGQVDTALPNVKSELLSEEEAHTVYRMQFEILEGLYMTGLFFKVKGGGKKPLVIVQHGGDGTPERISGVYGSTTNYNGILERVICHGVNAFAPQLLLWNAPYEVPFDRKSLDARLKRVGGSITALEVYGIKRILDYFESKDFVSTFGMVGLSYGGFYTLFTTAADTRIKAAISCSFFNKRDYIPWIDWTWKDSAYKFDDAEIAALIYPRKLWIEIGDDDKLFDYKGGVESFESLKEICSEVGCDWVNFKVFGGVHEFYKEDDHIEGLIKELFRE